MIKISKNYYRGTQIKSADEIEKLVENRESIYQPQWGIKPAAFYYSLQLRVVSRLIKAKQIFKIRRIKK